MFRTVRGTKKGWLPTPEEGDEFLTLEPFYFVWNEHFKSLWEIGFIQQMSEATAEMTEEQKAHKPDVIIRERALINEVITFLKHNYLAEQIKTLTELQGELCPEAA